MKVSLIIPTLNAASYLADLLGKLNDQSRPADEIIIIDSESDDATAAIARQHGATVINQPRETFNHGGTRNRAAEASGGDILIFLTQDVIPADSDLIANLIAPFNDQSVAAAYGRQIAFSTARPSEKYVRTFNYPAVSRIKSKSDLPALGVKTFFCSNACAAYRRSVHEELGGFRSDTIMNEDMEFAYRLIMHDQRIAYTAGAVVEHSHDYSFMQQLGRYVDIGVFFRDNPELAACAGNEGEGLRYILNAVRHLISIGEYLEIVHLITDAGARFIGYRLGYRYKSIPTSIIRRFSMHRGYWA